MLNCPAWLKSQAVPIGQRKRAYFYLDGFIYCTAGDVLEPMPACPIGSIVNELLITLESKSWLPG